MVIAFIPTLLSGLMLFWFLPEGGRFSGQVVFMGLSRQVWITMHDRWGIIFSILVILHLERSFSLNSYHDTAHPNSLLSLAAPSKAPMHLCNRSMEWWHIIRINNLQNG